MGMPGWIPQPRELSHSSGEGCVVVAVMCWLSCHAGLAGFRIFFPNQACLGVLIVRKRDRSGSGGPAVPPQPCGGSPSYVAMWLCGYVAM